MSQQKMPKWQASFNIKPPLAFGEIKNLTTYYIALANGSDDLNLITVLAGRPHSSFFPAPNLAFRYGVTPQWKVPSYLIRVWPGGQGHHVVHTGLLR